MKSGSYFIRCLLIIAIAASAGIAEVRAQTDNRYFIADQLFKQQKFERAYDIFRQLHRDDPGSIIYFERMTESLVNLKRYEDAIEAIRRAMERPYYPQEAAIRLAEVFHTQGDTASAYETWDNVLEQSQGNFQTYLSVARSMKERRVFDRAIEVYKKAGEMFSNSSVISSELAQAYLQAGRYEESVREYLSLIQNNPDRISYVQSVMLRFNDDYLYDIAILEIGDFLEELPDSNPAHLSLLQLEVWLLMERELYERAYVTARNYEQQHNRVTYTLYGLGAKLLSEQKFELAEKSFRHYVENNILSAKSRSMEELGTVYTEWANYLANYNLGTAAQRDSLYRKAYDILNRLRQSDPGYQYMDRVLISQAELALDHLHHPEEARNFLAALEGRADSSNLAQRAYIDGRIELYEKDYARARVSFTRSNKQERIGSLAQKTRYYLALTDFYSGDYEFAKIQLNALERQNTSYFANDAVQLRVWIQEGLQADSTGKKIRPFAKAVEHFSQGESEQAVRQLDSLLSTDGFHPLADEALLEMSSHAGPGYTPTVYEQITKYLNLNGRYSPLRERLLWEKARLADRHSAGKPNRQQADTTGENGITIPTSQQDIIALYEQILVEYPQGFYASYARNRIQELQKPQT